MYRVFSWTLIGQLTAAGWALSCSNDNSADKFLHNSQVSELFSS